MSDTAPSGGIRVDSRWTSDDAWGAVRCSLGRFRLRYGVSPGLYALARPGRDSPVVVTASYKLTFDLVRRDLRGTPCWILVLDTGGMGVASACAAGTFSTEELVARVQKARLSEIVTHRDLILPSLVADTVDAALVLKHTGFRVRFGPARSGDLPAFLKTGEAPPGMRRPSFRFAERLLLTPIELGRAFKALAVFVPIAFLYAGWTPAGVVFDRGWYGAWPLYVLALGAALAGSFLTPALLPWIPVRPVWAKGWIIGAAAQAALIFGAGLTRKLDPFLVAGSLLFFPAASAFLARLFTKSLPDAAPESERRQARIFLPLFAVACVLAALAFVLSKLR